MKQEKMKVIHQQALRLGSGGNSNIWLPRSRCGHWYVELAETNSSVTCKTCLAIMQDPTTKSIHSIKENK